MTDMEPDKAVNHGWHIDKFYPGAILSQWNKGPVDIVRRRKYEDRANQHLKAEAWTAAISVGSRRLALRLERKI